MDIIKLKSRRRPSKGKSYVRKLRQQGWIPAIYYGRSIKPESIEIDCREFGALLRAGKSTHLIDLGLSESEGDSVAIIKEIQREVLMPEHIQHVDFQHTSLNEEVSVEIPVELVGTPIGVLEEEGVLNHPAQTLMVECLARNIPEKITVDVSQLHIGDAIHVKDLSVADVVFKDAPDEVVAIVTRASKIEVAAPVAVEGAEGEAAEGEAAEGEKPAGEKEAPVEEKEKKAKKGESRE